MCAVANLLQIFRFCYFNFTIDIVHQKATSYMSFGYHHAVVIGALVSVNSIEGNKDQIGNKDKEKNK